MSYLRNGIHFLKGRRIELLLVQFDAVSVLTSVTDFMFYSIHMIGKCDFTFNLCLFLYNTIK